jgi:alpha-tubulin suppressor-like RCC1 family protein
MNREQRRTIRLAVIAGLAAITVATAPAMAQERSEGLQPTTVVADLTAVAAGDAHSCAVTTDHQVRCWGGNDFGQVGVGRFSAIEGVSVVRNRAGTGPLTGVVAVTTGAFHSCALLTSHEVRCWGSDSFGQIGDGHQDNRTLPVPVIDASGGRLRDVVQLSAGGNGSCAVLASGEVRCWGNNEDGQGGVGAPSTSLLRATPVLAVVGARHLTGVTQVDAAPAGVCARLRSGEARCWGQNGSFLLGDGTDVDRPRPVVVRNGAGTGPLTGVRRISVGDYHTCAVRTDGTARCWGTDAAGQLGDGAVATRGLPTTVVADATGAPLRGIATVDAAGTHSCARLTNGQARCWGANGQDQLGNGVEAGGPVGFPSVVRNRQDTRSLVGVAQLSTSRDHTCVRLTNGQARCWGYGQTGALGDLGTTNRPLPRTVVVAVN